MRFLSLMLTCVLLNTLVFAQNRTDERGFKQGPWKKYYPKSTQVRYEGTFKDNIPVGIFTYYDKNNQLEGTVTHQGNGISYAKNFYTGGNLKSEGKFINQKKDSTWTIYRDDKTVLSIEEYQNDKLNGKVIIYHVDGKMPSLESLYKDNVLEGKSIAYYENGKIQTEKFFVAGKLNGPAKMYFYDGKVKTEGQYLNDLSDGKWANYTNSGTLSMYRVFKRGIIDTVIRMNGQFDEYHPNETLKSSYLYSNGKKDGNYREFYEGSWKLEDKTDPNTGTTEKVRVLRNQVLKEEGSYLNGKLHGVRKNYDTSGKLLKSQNFTLGVAK